MSNFEIQRGKARPTDAHAHCATSVVKIKWICINVAVVLLVSEGRAASAQSFTLWQQTTIEVTCHDHSIINWSAAPTQRPQ